MTDWQQLKQLILDESGPCVRALSADLDSKGDSLSAVGYVYEFGRGQLCFEMCANTSRNAKETAEEDRWNSGDYDYPGGVQEIHGNWSDALWLELSVLDRLAQDQEQSPVVHDTVAKICCEVLAELTRSGVIGDWQQIDFNVAALLDELNEVEQRDRRIRELIEIEQR